MEELPYGVLEEQSEINIKVSQKSIKALKLQSDRVEEKQIFKKNFNF
jgi:hypothetical protein